jgi:hypothetical protein
LAGVAAEAPVLGCHVVCVDSRRYVEYHIWVPLVLDRRELWVVNSPELAMLELEPIKMYSYIMFPVRVLIPSLCEVSVKPSSSVRFFTSFTYAPMLGEMSRKD